VGDPTDAALIAVGRKAGLEQDALLHEERRIREIPFASERQFAASFHERAGAIFVYVKGGPGRVLERCARWLSKDGERPLDKGARDRLLEVNAQLAARGLRVLALADGPVDEPSDGALRDLTLLGLVGMIDPPAAGVADTIRLFRKAGIRTVMITGDQHRTAEAVGRELGVISEGEDVLDAREFSKLDDDALADRLLRTGAISRVGPEDKLRLVDAFQRKGEIVAMLGDGVNDAPALKSADVGVAMGIRGTDVAREAAAVVLQDDRFPTIGAAIEEGRVIYDNIRKFVFYLFSCNLSEILVLLGAGLVGLPLPLLPLQILWLNLVTDTFPALSLALEPAEPDVMQRPPRDPRAAIMSAAFLRSVLAYGFLIGVVCMAAYSYGLVMRENIEEARTICFMTLAIAQLFHLVNARSRHAVVFTGRLLTNRWALYAALLVLALQLIAVYVAPLALVLEVVPPRGVDWLVILGLSMLPALVGQALRWKTA
jgi:Ca2+-transporting ATPase